MTITEGPPALSGYTPMGLIGRGGHADVYTYQQHSPKRTVAVKVLAAPDHEDVTLLAASLRAEADYLAELSQHPSIVTVHHAGVAEDGRPYLVMDYCSRPGLGAIYRRQRLGVADVLRIGVRLASAVETAHRAGVLHRDIKPANVLVTDFGWPALADFGIAGAIDDKQIAGLSIPWASPELLRHDHVDERSDVYSLAATLYALLAQRSPYEVPGGENAPYDLMARIERGHPPRTGRTDVPAGLEGALERSLGPASGRPQSAAALGRLLQQVESDLGLPVTDLDLAETPSLTPSWLETTKPTKDDKSGKGQPSGGIQPWEATRVRPIRDLPGTSSDTSGTAHTIEPSAPRPSTPRLLAISAAVVVVVILAVGLVRMLPTDVEEPTVDPSATLELSSRAPNPTNLDHQLSDGTARITWVNPVPQEGDYYLWRISGEQAQTETSDNWIELPVTDGIEVCVEIWIVRQSGVMSDDPGGVCVGS
ncbi:MAG: serine/threonine-protein kinase [Beutenbergiaceae bacterium]